MLTRQVVDGVTAEKALRLQVVLLEKKAAIELHVRKLMRIGFATLDLWTT